MFDASITYESPIALLDEIESAIQSIKIHWDKQQVSDLSNRQNAFECVREIDNKTVSLIPIIRTPSMLFRGENKVYDQSTASSYRSELTERYYLFSLLKVTEMQLLLKRHPMVSMFKKDYNMVLSLSPLGIAQHYGVKTPLIDFTGDPNIAMFFATCKYDSATDSYVPNTDKDKEGIIWIMNPAFVNFFNNGHCFDFPIKAIGGQPFFRPARQKGFALWMLSPNQTLQNTAGCIPCKFKYTEKDSISFLEKYKNGDLLWSKNVTDCKASQIANKNTISREAYDLFLEQSDFSGFLPLLLQKYGTTFVDLIKTFDITISDESDLFVFSKDEFNQIQKEYSSLSLYYRNDIPKDPSAEISSRLVSYKLRPLHKDVVFRNISTLYRYSHSALMDMFYLTNQQKKQ